MTPELTSDADNDTLGVMSVHLRSTRVGVDDGELAVWSGGGSGRPIVFLHGGALDHRMWELQTSSFGTTNRVVAVDARGHGESSTADAAYRHCDDLAAVFRALELAPAVIVGLSLGGGTAVDLALEYPDLVSGLVVSGTGTSEPTFTDPWVLDTFAEWAAAEADRDPQRWVDAFLRFLPGPHRTLGDVDPAIVDEVRQMAWDTVHRHAVHAFVPPTPVARTWERVPGIEVPLVAVSGALDSPDHIAMSHRLATSAAHGRAVDIPGTAHYPNLEVPGAFDEAVALVAR
jgi:pimeloyl-ACP methyl ester carboxylesterase